MEARQMEAFFEIAQVVELMDNTEDEMGKIFSKLATVRASALRVLINGQLRTHKPAVVRPQFPEIRIDEALTKHRTLRNAGLGLIPLRAAANLFAKLKLEAEATGPPYAPFPAPKLQFHVKCGHETPMQR